MSDLKITKVSVSVVKIPVRATHSHGSGDITGAVNSVILRLDTDAGITGWGEASPWSVFTGTLEAAYSTLDVHFRAFLEGADPFKVNALLAEADRRVVRATEAKAAMETALLDICGKATGRPLHDYLGGRCWDEIPLSFSVANPNFDEDVEQVREMVAEGHKIFKMKTGFKDHAFDVMRLEKLRDLFGDSIDLRVDYNQGLTPYDALPKLRDVESFEPTFIEQPIPMEQRETMAELARDLDVPLMADETVFTVRDAVTAVQMRAADLFSLKIMKSGGAIRAREIAAVAKAAGIGVYGGCMFETGIAHAAGTHLMATIPELTLGCEFYMPTYYLADDILTEPFPAGNGVVRVPTGPGLGVSVDEDKLAKYTV